MSNPELEDEFRPISEFIGMDVEPDTDDSEPAYQVQIHTRNTVSLVCIGVLNPEKNIDVLLKKIDILENVTGHLISHIYTRESLERDLTNKEVILLKVSLYAEHDEKNTLIGYISSGFILSGSAVMDEIDESNGTIVPGTYSIRFKSKNRNSLLEKLTMDITSELLMEKMIENLFSETVLDEVLSMIGE